MKIWPFDDVARANGGKYISAAELRSCLEPFEKVRGAVGDRIEIMVELHGLWEVAPAIRICRALVDYSPYWVEDAVRLDSYDAVGPLCAEATTTRSRSARPWPACTPTSGCSTAAPSTSSCSTSAGAAAFPRAGGLSALARPTGSPGAPRLRGPGGTGRGGPFLRGYGNASHPGDGAR